jgi:hypothetical protein
MDRSFLILKKHFQKSFMELGEICAAIAAIKLYLTQDLGVIQFLAETSVAVLEEAGSKNYPIGHF